MNVYTVVVCHEKGFVKEYGHHTHGMMCCDVNRVMGVLCGPKELYGGHKSHVQTGCSIIQ